VTITVLFKNVNVTGMTLSKDTMLLASGASETLIATVTPENALDRNVTWSITGDGTIATVDQTGRVTANSAGRSGSVIVTATASNGLSASCTVTVPPVSVTGVTLNRNSMTITTGREEQLTATIAPLNATNRNVTWSTSNTSVATVSNGVITARAAGRAIITVTTLDGNKTAHGTVTVTSGSADRQAYYESKFPGKHVIILPDGGVLIEANGNTVIVGGRGNDRIEMSGGGNVFVYELGGGHDLVTNVNVEAEARNELRFGPGITGDDLSFFKRGDDLRISIAGENGDETGSVTIENWYIAEQYRLRVFLHDGTELSLNYMISASAVTCFGSLQAPYEQPAAQTVTITNTGVAAITLTQPTATNYEIGELSTTSLTASGSTATFTVRPRTGLPVGNHNETITISGGNGASAVVNVSFEVTAEEIENIAGGGCNVTIGYVLAMWLALLLVALKKKR